MTITSPSTALFSVTDALPLASVVELLADRVPMPEVTAKLTTVPAGTTTPSFVFTLAVTVTGMVMRTLVGELVTVMLDGEVGSIKLTVFTGLVTAPTDAVISTVCGAAIPLRVAVATPFVVVVTAEIVPAVEVNVTTVRSAMTPLGPKGVTVAVRVTGALIFTRLAPVTATDCGEFALTNVTSTVLAGSEPTVAVTVNAPVAALVRIAVALPEESVVVTAERVPPVVAKETTVPLFTAVPSACRTLAVIVTGVLRDEVAAEDVSVMVAGASGPGEVPPPPPPPQPNTINVSRDNNRLYTFLTFMIFLLFLSGFYSNSKYAVMNPNRNIIKTDFA